MSAGRTQVLRARRRDDQLRLAGLALVVLHDERRLVEEVRAVDRARRRDQAELRVVLAHLVLAELRLVVEVVEVEMQLPVEGLRALFLRDFRAARKRRQGRDADRQERQAHRMSLQGFSNVTEIVARFRAALNKKDRGRREGIENLTGADHAEDLTAPRDPPVRAGVPLVQPPGAQVQPQPVDLERASAV